MIMSILSSGKWLLDNSFVTHINYRVFTNWIKQSGITEMERSFNRNGGGEGKRKITRWKEVWRKRERGEDQVREKESGGRKRGSEKDGEGEKERERVEMEILHLTTWVSNNNKGHSITPSYTYFPIRTPIVWQILYYIQILTTDYFLPYISVLKQTKQHRTNLTAFYLSGCLVMFPPLANTSTLKIRNLLQKKEVSTNNVYSFAFISMYKHNKQWRPKTWIE